MSTTTLRFAIVIAMFSFLATSQLARIAAALGAPQEHAESQEDLSQDIEKVVMAIPDDKWRDPARVYLNGELKDENDYVMIWMEFNQIKDEEAFRSLYKLMCHAVNKPDFPAKARQFAVARITFLTSDYNFEKTKDVMTRLVNDPDKKVQNVANVWLAKTELSKIQKQKIGDFHFEFFPEENSLFPKLENPLVQKEVDRLKGLTTCLAIGLQLLSEDKDTDFVQTFVDPYSLVYPRGSAPEKFASNLLTDDYIYFLRMKALWKKQLADCQRQTPNWLLDGRVAQFALKNEKMVNWPMFVFVEGYWRMEYGAVGGTSPPDMPDNSEKLTVDYFRELTGCPVVTSPETQSAEKRKADLYESIRFSSELLKKRKMTEWVELVVDPYLHANLAQGSEMDMESYAKMNRFFGSQIKESEAMKDAERLSKGLDCEPEWILGGRVAILQPAGRPKYERQIWIFREGRWRFASFP